MKNILLIISGMIILNIYIKIKRKALIYNKNEGYKALKEKFHVYDENQRVVLMHGKENISNSEKKDIIYLLENLKYGLMCGLVNDLKGGMSYDEIINKFYPMLKYTQKNSDIHY